MTADITVAVVGLGFGEEFVPIYLSHPEVARVVLVEPDAARQCTVAERYGLSDTVDAVHVLAPVAMHADMSVAALEAGKHVASAVRWPPRWPTAIASSGRSMPPVART